MVLSRCLGRVVFVGFLITLVTVCESAFSCPTGQPPTGQALGVNDARRGQALYWLNVGRARFGYRPNHLYKLDITSLDYPFTDAMLTLEEEDPTTGCGIGHFNFDTDDLFQYENCEKMLLTNKKEPMTQLPPFTWTAPGCGCVIVNATVIRDGSTYYMDQEVSKGGVLSKRLCPRYPTPSAKITKAGRVKTLTTTTTTTPTTTTTTTTTQKPRQIKKMNRLERMDLLCQISIQFKGAELLAREIFMRRREIFKLNMTSLIRLELALDQRRGDIHDCCKFKASTSKTRCFDDMRRRRIDRFCSLGVPDVPFIAKRADFMKTREHECCWRLGESRYRCFGVLSRLVRNKGDNSIEYSMDEMDPVNDIGDYPSEIEEVEKVMNSDFFVDDANRDVVIRGQEKLTYTASSVPTVPTPTSPTTITTPETKLTNPNQADTMVSHHLSSRVLTDYTHVTDVKSTAKQIKKTAPRVTTKRSTVDEELKVLRQKAWKLELKLTCCQQGKSIGEGIDVQQSIYNHCRQQWRNYRRGLKKGKTMCMNMFMECCVDEAGMSSTQATYTQKSNPSDPAVKKETETTTMLTQTQLVASAQQGQGHSKGSKRLSGHGQVQSGAESKLQQTTRRAKSDDDDDDTDDEDLHPVGSFSKSSVRLGIQQEVTSPLPTLTSKMDDDVDSEVDDEEIPVEKEEDYEQSEENDSSEREIPSSKSDIADNSQEIEEEDLDDDDEDDTRKKKSGSSKSKRHLKTNEKHVRAQKQMTTLVPTTARISVDSPSVDSPSHTNGRYRSRSSQRSRRGRKHRGKHKGRKSRRNLKL